MALSSTSHAKRCVSKMNWELSKNDVQNLLLTWNNWMRGPDPANNKPDEFKLWAETSPNGIKLAFGLVLHIFLWAVIKIGLILNLTALAIWGSKVSIKYDHLWWEPKSCGLNNAYTNLGMAYLKSGNITKAIRCLENSWRVFPCPHNTSYGLKLNLFKKLRNYSEAKDAVTEYSDIWGRFKRA